MGKLANICALTAIFLVIAGATVTSTGAGDSIPDWPLSYKSLIPPLVGNVIYEYSHRVIAAITAILIFILTIWSWIIKQSKLIRWLSTSVFIAIILQAFLGGLRVLIVSDENIQKVVYSIIGKVHNKDLRILFAILHAVLAQVVLAVTFIIATITSRKWQEATNLTKVTIGIKIICVIFVLLIFCQLIFGAMLRHKEIGLIIPDFPTSFGYIIPNFNNLPYNPNAPFPLTYAEFKISVILNFIHRVFALLILFFALALLFYVKNFYSKNKQLVRLIFVIFFHIILQVILGAIVVWTRAPILLTIIHTAIGASILGLSATFLVWVFHPVYSR